MRVSAVNRVGGLIGLFAVRLFDLSMWLGKYKIATHYRRDRQARLEVWAGTFHEMMRRLVYKRRDFDEYAVCIRYDMKTKDPRLQVSPAWLWEDPAFVADMLDAGRRIFEAVEASKNEKRDAADVRPN